jgi:hypothetical protein
LAERAERVARRFRWAGAIPTTEPIRAAYPAPPRPARLTVLAADGSQIYPDRHGLALYYVINVGSIAFRYHTAHAPETFGHPHLFYADDDLYAGPRAETIVTTEIINARRDVREMAELARLATVEAPHARAVALLDNSLLLYLMLRDDQPAFKKEIDMLIEAYLAELDTLRASGAALAGIVDRPGSANVVRLLHIAQLDADQISQDDIASVGENFLRLTDSALFGFLAPGERSALFKMAAPASLEKYEPRGHAGYFFFLNAGDSHNLLRVEVPEWVARDAARLTDLHAALVAQCKTGGFPYVLARAHEEAVIRAQDKTAVDQAIAGALARHSLGFEISRKQAQKNSLNTRRRYP